MATSAQIPHCSTGTAGPCWYSTTCPDDSEGSTAATVQGMLQHIRESQSSPYIGGAARSILSERNGLTNAGGQQIAAPRFVAADPITDAATRAFLWCKLNLKFQPDEVRLWQRLNKMGATDFLQSPAVLIQDRDKRGDCDDFTMMLCALLRAMGIGFRIVTVKCDSRDPSRWSHVYCVVTTSTGQRLPLDASHGKYPGWEVPGQDVYEYAEWDESGAKIPTQLSPVPMSGYSRGRRRPNLTNVRRGVGDGDTSGDEPGGIAGDTTTTNVLYPYATGPVATDPIGSATYYPTPGSVATPSGMSPAVASTLASATAKLLSIFGQTVAPQTTIQTPQGLLITGPAGAIQNTALPGLTANALQTSTGSLLPLLAIGLAAFVVVKMVSK